MFADLTNTPAPLNPTCASDGCGLPASVYFEKGGVGSHYCSGCGMRIQSLRPNTPAPASSPDIAKLRHECAASGYHEHDGCTCDDTELLKRTASEAADVEPVALTYTNWRGETALRTVLPLRIWYGATEWHPDPQWLLTAVDVDKGVERDFALTGFASPSTEVERLTRERQTAIDAANMVARIGIEHLARAETAEVMVGRLTKERDEANQRAKHLFKQGEYAEATIRSLKERLAEAERRAMVTDIAKAWPYGTHFSIEHDGFAGRVIGWYVRLDGKAGVVGQIDGARIVHVYGDKWLSKRKEGQPNG